MQIISDFLNLIYADYRWIIKIFSLVFITLIINFIWRRYYKSVQLKLKKTVNVWDDALWEAVHKPAGLLIWIVGLSYAAEISPAEIDPSFQALLQNIRAIAVISIISWFIFRFIHLAEDNVLVNASEKPDAVDKTTVNAVAKLLRAAVIISGMLIIMQTLGYSISGLLAFGGVGGLAVGFAAKDLLSNFFGGLMVYLDKPFKIGDWVRSSDRQIEGVVEYIGWRQTRIRTFDKRPLYVPNSVFTTITVENPSRMLNRRIYETIGIRYEDAGRMGEIVSKVKDMLLNHPDIDTEQTLIVNFNEFAASSLNFFVYTFTKTTNWIEYHKIKQDVMLKIIEIVEGSGAEMAFPTQTLHFAEPISTPGD